jgi:hypothetical protein
MGVHKMISDNRNARCIREIELFTKSLFRMGFHPEAILDSLTHVRNDVAQEWHYETHFKEER